jgi:hypothetical protein
MSKDELTTQPYTDEDAKGAVTAFDVGLGNVDNKALANVEFSDLQATRYTDSEAKSAVSASDVGLSNVENKALSQASFADLAASPGDVSKADVGLDNVPNEDATKPSNLDSGSASDGDVLQVSGSQPTFAPSPAGGAWSKISTIQVSSPVSSVDFISGIDSTYSIYVVKAAKVTPDTDNVNLYLLFNDGSGFDTIQKYAYVSEAVDSSGAVNGPVGDPDANEFTITFAMGSDTGECGYFNIAISHPSDQNKKTAVNWEGAHRESSSTVVYSVRGSGIWDDAEEITGIRLLMDEGNIESGLFTLYGINQ